MDKAQLLLLLEKYRRGNCTPEEEIILHKWLDALEEDHTNSPMPASALLQVKQQMQEQIWPISAIPPRRIGLRIIKVAATIIPLVVASYFLWQWQHSQKSDKQLATVMTWQTIRNTGRQLQRIMLPDHSLVLLGPYSCIQYPPSFSDTARSVKLTEGKAFFDITANSRPFTVEDNSGVRTTVLGTSFTIENSTTFQMSRVAVATGKVKVQRNGAAAAILGPSQRLTYREGNIIQDSISSTDLLAWTSGEIVLRNATLQELLFTIKNQYGITATTSLNVNQGNYTLRFPTTMGLQEVLNIIEKISYRPKVHFTMRKNNLSNYELRVTNDECNP